MKQFKKYYDFAKEHWAVIVFLSSAFWGFVTLLFKTFALPIVDAHIDSRVITIGKDSMPVMVHRILEEQPVGFRGQLSPIIGIPKPHVADSFGQLYLDDKIIKAKLDGLLVEFGYHKGITKAIIKQAYELYTWEGVELYRTDSGDFMYLDSLGYLWDATYKMGDGCFYFYPPYNDNKRTKCIKYEKQ